MPKRDKRVEQAIRCAVEAGWELHRTTRGHPKLVPPRGWVFPRGGARSRFVTAGTSSDHRGVVNFISDLRRAGVPIPHKGHTPGKQRSSC